MSLDPQPCGGHVSDEDAGLFMDGRVGWNKGDHLFFGYNTVIDWHSEEECDGTPHEFHIREGF